jgi:hypothetical protein
MHQLTADTEVHLRNNRMIARDIHVDAIFRHDPCSYMALEKGS